MYNLEILEKGCEELGITLSDTQKNQFIRFYEYLVEKNKVMNLTGITEFDEVLVKHFLDSLCCVKAVDMGKIKTVMDIGTGAGFPGVPLKIAFPEVEACLLDSLNKRVKFLEETFALLGLEGISAIHGRAEEYAKNKARINDHGAGNEVGEQNCQKDVTKVSHFEAAMRQLHDAVTHTVHQRGTAETRCYNKHTCHQQGVHIRKAGQCTGIINTAGDVQGGHRDQCSKPHGDLVQHIADQRCRKDHHTDDHLSIHRFVFLS